MQRRDFLTQGLQEVEPPKTDPALALQNQKLPDVPTGVGNGTPYSGTWGKAQVRHLLRRTLFGFTKDDVDFFAAKTMEESVDYIMNIPLTAPTPPLNNYNTVNKTDPNIPAGQTWVNGPDDGNFNGERRRSYYAWWMEQTLKPERHIREKMVLFWHNHFATEAEVIGAPIFAYNYNALLRKNCLGNFKTFVNEMTVDCGMLRYLNGYLNTKTAPDENYARELMELFTLGKGPDSQYTEDDVKAGAKVLTGWRINYTTYTSYFDANKHDTSNKVFSSFFGNNTITGQSGAAGADETSDLIDMIFSKEDVVSKFIVRKLYRYFVYYVIDSNVETNIITPLAASFKTDWDIKKVLTTLLKSEHFYDVGYYGAYIKNPIDVITQFIKAFKITIDNSPVEDFYAGNYLLWSLGAGGGMTLGNPPNVSGWPAYYQDPQYYEIWINSDSLPKRIQVIVGAMALGLKYTKSGKLIIADVIAFAQQFSSPGTPDTLIQDSIDLLLPFDLSASTKAGLKTSTLLFGQTQDHYWTDAWNDYLANPSDPTKKGLVTIGLQSMLKFLLDTAENQLA